MNSTDTVILHNKQYVAWSTTNDGQGWITFFTPSYNRASFLPRIYECLKSQTDHHFVWILVCDGSTDNSVDVAKKLLAKEDY